MALIWILLLNFGFVRCHILNVTKDDDNVQTYHDNDVIEDILKKGFTTLPIKREFSAMEAGQQLKEALLNEMYLDSAWKQLLAQIDVWELTGTLSSKLSSVSPAQVKDEDASDLLDYILSTVKPFLNNSMVIADVGTALNMHNCSVNGVIEGLQRNGPVKLIINDDLVTLSFTITTNTLSMSCDWHQWMVMKYYGIVSGILTSITVSTIVDLKLQPNQNPVIRKTEVKELGEIISDITGIGPLGMLVKTIMNKMIQQYRKLLIDSLEHEAPIHIQYSLDNITLPEAENITSAFDNTLSNIKIKNSEKYTDDKNTETATENIVKYSEERDNKSQEIIQNKIVNPKFKNLETEVKISKSNINEKISDKDEEEESVQIINPKFKIFKNDKKLNKNTNEEDSEIKKENSDLDKQEKNAQIIHPKLKYLKKDEKANKNTNEEETEIDKANSEINQEESHQIIPPKFRYLKEDEKANNEINNEESEFIVMIENEDRMYLEYQTQKYKHTYEE